MKLFTKDIDKKLFQQYPIGNDLENQVVVAKIFNPYGRGVWYLLNSDPEDPDYIWAIVDLFEVEVGSVSRSELESIKVPPFNLHLERDMYFSPINAAELYRGLIAGKQYANGGGIEADKEGNELFAKGGVVKQIPEGRESYYMGASHIEREIMDKIRGQLSTLTFAGNFFMPEWKSSSDAYLYNLDEFDKKYVSGIKLKEGERIFRYYTRTSAIGGMIPLVKINTESGLVYFPVYGSDGEVVGFDSKGTRALYINLVKDDAKFADGGNVSDVEFVDTNKGTFITPDEGSDSRAAILFEDGGATFDWSEVFKPLTDEEIERSAKELKENESADLKRRKDAYKEKIRASGKDWNDAFLRRVRAVKNSIQDFVDAHNRGSESATNYARYAFEEIEGVKEMGFGASKYANELEKKFRTLYDKAMIKNQKIDKFAHGGRLKVDKKYTHFAVRKSDGKIVTGWDYKGTDKEDISTFSKMDLNDMDIDPKTVSVLTKMYLIGKGIDPFNWDNWIDPKEYYANGGSTKSKCEKYVSSHEAVTDNGYYFDFSTIKNFVDPYAQLPKIDMNFCMVTYNSGGQKGLKVTDTVNSSNLVKELSSELGIEKESAMMLLSVYLKKAHRLNSISDLNGNKTIVVDRDKIVCSDLDLSGDNYRIFYLKVYENGQVGTDVKSKVVYANSEAEAKKEFKRLHPTYQIDNVSKEFDKGGSIEESDLDDDNQHMGSIDEFYKWSRTYVAKKFKSSFVAGSPIAQWDKDEDGIIVKSASGELKNGKKVEYDDDEFEWVETDEFAKGGSVTKKAKFSDKVKAISEKLKGKTVKPKYRKTYGKTYDPKEAKEAAQRIAGAAKAKTEKKK